MARHAKGFRWPAAQTLFIGLGLVPWPVPAQNGGVTGLVPGVKRCDMVLVVEPRLSGGR